MPFIPYIIAILILFIVLKVLSMPMKIIIKFLINAVIGGIVIYVLNLFGVRFSYELDYIINSRFLRNTGSNHSCNFTIRIPCILKMKPFGTVLKSTNTKTS